VQYKGTDTGDFRSLEGSKKGIFQQAHTEALSLIFPVDREACQHHYRNRIGHVAPYAARSFRVRYGARGQRVVAGYAAAVGDDKRA